MPARRRRSSLREVTSTAHPRTEPIEAIHPSASFSTTVRVRLENHPGAFAGLARAIADAGGLLGAIDLVRVEHDTKVRDVTILAGDAAHAEHIVDAIRGAEGVDVLRVSDRTFLLHLGGKIEMNAKSPLKTRDDLSMAYTPGVARVSQAISADPAKAWTLTIKHNAVAVVSDGTAVLGLGDIGPEAAMPVMEGKALLFKEFGGIDAWPLCLDTKDPDEIVTIVKAIAPGFGGINLEDISAPRCFEIERRLRAELDIPVFHDDQHGTAIVVLAALINALRVVDKDIADVQFVISGVGAAGSAIIRLLKRQGATMIIGCDSKGAVYDAQDIANMAKDAIVFGLANPIPEVDPAEAQRHAAVVATGRSDYPNQINNVLAFPGVFRGLLDGGLRHISDEMLSAAANAIANQVAPDQLNPSYIIPSVFDASVAPAVAAAVREVGEKEHAS